MRESRDVGELTAVTVACGRTGFAVSSVIRESLTSHNGINAEDQAAMKQLFLPAADKDSDSAAP